MVPQQQTEGEDLSLRRRVRRYWIEERRLIRIVRSVIVHAVVAFPLDALLKWLGVPAICAFLAAAVVAVTVKVVCLKDKAKDVDS